LYNTLGNSTGYIRRTYPVVNGQTYCYSIYAKAKELNYLWLQNFTDAGAFAGDQVAFDLINGDISYNPSPSRIFYPTITSVGNGWYRCSMCQTVGLNYTYTGAGGIVAAGPGSQFGAAGTGDGKSGILIWGAQMEQLNSVPSIYTSMTTVPTPVAKRVDYNGKIYITGTFDEVTYNPNSGISTNLIINSQTFTGTDWSKINASISSGTELAPDGSSTASFYKESYSITFDAHQLYKGINPLANNTFYVLSCYYKPTENRYIIPLGLGNAAFGGADRTAAFNLKTLTVSGISSYVTNYGITDVGNGWYRCFVTMQSTASGFGTIGICTLLGKNDVLDGYSGDGASGIYVWGAQLEVGDSGPNSRPSMYVPTTTSIVPNVPYISRQSANGNSYVKNTYDEWTGFNVVTDGLVVHLDAAIPTSWPGSGTTWYDLSGNGLNATPIYYSTSLGFFDTSSYSFAFQYPLSQKPMVLPNLAILKTPSFSCEAWVKQTGYNASNEYWNQLFGGEQYLTNGFRCGVTGDGRPTFWTNQSGGNFSLTSSIYTTLNKFYHLVITYDLPSQTVNMYINGVNAGTVRNAVYNVPTNTSQFGIGGAMGGTYDQIGNIATFKMYNRAISQQEASDNFTATRNRFSV
jgi:hypothetical protein